MPGRMSAEWWRDYRARNRDRVNAQQRARRALGRQRGDRSIEYARRRSRALPTIPVLHIGHALFDQARQIVGPRRSTLVTLVDPLYDDLLSEATLALLEGTDPVKAVRTYRARERAFGRVTCQLVEAAA